MNPYCSKCHVRWSQDTKNRARTELEASSPIFQEKVQLFQDFLVQLPRLEDRHCHPTRAGVVDITGELSCPTRRNSHCKSVRRNHSLKLNERNSEIRCKTVYNNTPKNKQEIAKNKQIMKIVKCLKQFYFSLSVFSLPQRKGKKESDFFSSLLHS